MTHDAPFSLPMPSVARPLRRATRLPILCAERVLGLSRLNALYAAWRARPGCNPGAFPDGALALIGAGYAVTSTALDRIPSSGSLVVVANHPHGALDGLVLASLVFRRRADVRLLGNSLLARVPELRPFTVFVDPFGDAAQRNSSGLREALDWMRRGGALIVFPAGEVSHTRRLGGPVVDPPWHPAVMRLAEHAHASVLPIHIDGVNGRLFQLAGLLHPWLRTALLPRELLRQRGRSTAVTVGTAIPWSQLEPLASARARTDYLRLRTLDLAPATPRTRPAVSPRPVVDAVDPAALAADIAALTPDRLLVTHGDCRVYCAPAAALPNVLREIGRLRELTFRAVGEGTGTSLDLDRYDRRYLHLFVWNARTQEIAGAYRLAPTDHLNAVRHPGRLYTRTLFRFGPTLCSSLGAALELGRSFVRAEYQRDYGTLLLLWKGIGRFVARAPRYRYLFGPVSISADYSAQARELMVAALSTPRFRSPMAGLVEPRRPVATRVPDVARACTGPEQLERLLADLGDRRGLPVLLRQYLKLNARFLGFSVDPAFNDALDGLAIVDLLDVEPSVLQRYMTREGLATFRAYHRPTPLTPASRPAVVAANC